MNPKTKLITWVVISTGTIGFSSLAIANLTTPNRSSSTIAQNGGMNHSGMNHEMNMTDAHKQSMMMSMSLGKADAGFDVRFLDAMIPHHQDAVTMGKDLLLKSKRPQMKKLAQSIIKSQQSEIDLMTQWQKEWAVVK